MLRISRNDRKFQRLETPTLSQARILARASASTCMRLVSVCANASTDRRTRLCRPRLRCSEAACCTVVFAGLTLIQSRGHPVREPPAASAGTVRLGGLESTSPSVISNLLL
jgi:hypothetical protein